ncbi:hypothetical protein IEO21_09875 [Rhodonia placenta]|uniref:AB hydrolase-1 domain-containing protein n=1 Tax=Rhodonia placenta TaxID=104341 RepID=A0A8H7TXU5_9APHY|nr:hypothetical protein IEO21_09875 [Postia placenta]
MSSSFSSEGTIPFTVDGETHQTWYRLFGDLTKRTHRPLVVIHGGPGLSHDYLLPIGDLATTASIPVILYDQVGTGRSTHLREKPASFWTIDLFLNELTNLVNHFGAQDDFDVLGHSWGGTLAIELAIRRRLPGMKHVVLSNTLAAKRLVKESNEMLQKNFPQEEREAWLAGPEHPLFGQASAHFFSLHGCLLSPPPQEMLYSLAQGSPGTGDTTVYNALSQGEYADWDVIDKLHTVEVPSLILNGRADYMQDFVNAPFFAHIPRVKWITFEKSSHMPFWEERERYMQVIQNFLSL